MPRVIVLPSIEDQCMFEAGAAPENFFDRSFETDKEVDTYLEGMEALDDLGEYEITEEGELHVTVVINGDTQYPTFETPGEKAAFLQGLEDGDGWRRPQTFTDKDLEFEDVLKLTADKETPAP